MNKATSNKVIQKLLTAYPGLEHATITASYNLANGWQALAAPLPADPGNLSLLQWSGATRVKLTIKGRHDVLTTESVWPIADLLG